MILAVCVSSREQKRWQNWINFWVLNTSGSIYGEVPQRGYFWTPIFAEPVWCRTTKFGTIAHLRERELLWHCWLGDRKSIRPVKHWVLVCWWWWIDWSLARLIAPVVTTTSIILCFHKLANPGSSSKMSIKTERERAHVRGREGFGRVARPTQFGYSVKSWFVVDGNAWSRMLSRECAYLPVFTQFNPARYFILSLISFLSTDFVSSTFGVWSHKHAI